MEGLGRRLGLEDLLLAPELGARGLRVVLGALAEERLRVVADVVRQQVVRNVCGEDRAPAPHIDSPMLEDDGSLEAELA